MDYSKLRLRTFTRLKPYYTLPCGSNYELPIKYSSHRLTDVDVLLYCYDICAIPWNRNPPKNTRCTILRIDSTATPSGYAKLKIHEEREKVIYYRRPPMLANVESGGPSIKRVEKYAKKILEEYKLGRFDVDMDKVFAIFCPYWPVEAEEWRKRKRFHGWPNEKLIARITRGGCHFVSKLRTWSSCDDTEWRFSFSKAELLLIHSWTPDQKYAYHVIRVVKRRISEYCVGDGNRAWQTYYFKTLMFWACEEFPPEFCREENAITFVEKLFIRFHRCLEEKFCPSYVIPECNIMSHLKNEERLEEELQMLQGYLVSGHIIRLICGVMFKNRIKSSFRIGSFEILCLQTTKGILLFNEHLNGRFAEYLSECEWFLPGMKSLHAAIEAHLRLMSFNNVAWRKESKDFVECLENFKCALIRNEDFESCRYADPNMSIYENFNAILRCKQSKNSFPIYRRGRCKCESCVQISKESRPSVLLCTVSAYRANFHFTAMQSYKESFIECKRGFDFVEKGKLDVGNFDNTQFASYVPVLICNCLSQIYDEHLQVILGFATLHRNIAFTESSNSSTCHETCLKLDPCEFMKYIYILSEKKLSLKPEVIECFVFSKTFFYRPSMSQLEENIAYSAAILFAALRQSRIYSEPLVGNLIPRHYSQVP